MLDLHPLINISASALYLMATVSGLQVLSKLGQVPTWVAFATIGSITSCFSFWLLLFWWAFIGGEATMPESMAYSFEVNHLLAALSSIGLHKLVGVFVEGQWKKY